MVDERIYKKNEVISFFKTDEKYGLLSNMKGKFYLKVNNMIFSSSEAIYQSLKFPNSSEIQQKIATEHSPMTAKRIAQTYSWKIRSDWDEKKICAMRVSIRIKALQSKDFFDLLQSTEKTEIVEISRKDDYWGTFIRGDELIGKNVLGRLLMELREESKDVIILHLQKLLNPVNNMKVNNRNIELTDLLMKS